MFKRFLVIVVALFACHITYAQSDKNERTIGIKTQALKVYGTCSMDKQRIEKAAYSVDGVRYATWNENSQVLYIKYSVFKTQAADNVQRKISIAGNDTEKYKASDQAYQHLPDCCHYQRH